MAQGNYGWIGLLALLFAAGVQSTTYTDTCQPPLCACYYADGTHGCYSSTVAGQDGNYGYCTGTPGNANLYTSNNQAYAQSQDTGGVCQGQTKGDPLMTSFSGCQWYLQGEAGAVFNLISESQHVVNTLLVPANLTDEYHNNDGTFHGAISIRYQDTVVTSSVNPQGNLTVRLMDSSVPFGTIRERGDLTLKVTEFYPYYGQVAEIVTPAFRFFLHAVQPYNSPSGFQRGHLDMTVTSIAGKLTMHGLLGQSDVGPGKLCPENMIFSGEGKESDYRMASLDSTDFTFGLFGVTKTTRRLQGMGNPTYGIATTPRMAGIGDLITEAA